MAGWRSHPDKGQSAAINEGIARGKAPYVGWLNSDDWLLPGALNQLLSGLNEHPQVPAVYGRAWNFTEKNKTMRPVWTEPFNVQRLAVRCIISQPATLIRRSAWEAIGGLDESLYMTMDYDLWWRLYKTFGAMAYLDEFVAVNRIHGQTKTKNNRRLHYQEAIKTIRKHHGHVPLKWWLAQPYKVWLQSILGQLYTNLYPMAKLEGELEIGSSSKKEHTEIALQIDVMIDALCKKKPVLYPSPLKILVFVRLDFLVPVLQKDSQQNGYSSPF